MTGQPARTLWAFGATLAAPALRLMLRRRAGRGKEVAARLGERWGEDATPRPAGRLLWLHAASVGETVSILAVLEALARKTPTLAILVTTGTVTSAELLALRLPEAGLAGRVIHRFVPLDVPAWVARFLDHWRPDAAAFVESEIWPNIIAACRARAIPMMLLNARLSARSFARWRLVPGLAAGLLGGFASIRARGPADAARFASLGAALVRETGDLKFAAPELPVDAAELARLRALRGGRPVWLAASTHPGEEAMVAAAQGALAARFPDLLSIIVPRHPARGAEIARALAAPRRAAGDDPPAAGGLYIADTLGELGLFYRLAPIAFIGGSLVPHGGQNPLEAARLGVVLATGPHTDNFAEAVAALAAAGALTRVTDSASLAAFVAAQLRDPGALAASGAAGQRAAHRWAELPEATAEALLGLLERRT